VLGDRIDMGTLRTAGLTDAEIARELCLSRGVDGAGAVGALLRAYERLLPERLGWRQGRVLPNVRENLEALSGREDVVNMLLTGNIAGGAEAKLRHYDLWDFFGAGGAFSVEGCDRPAIARRARELAAEHGGDVPPGERMVVIGDTPHDVRCGKAIGARTVAVASGSAYGIEDLQACDPWLALRLLPPPDEFGALLDNRDQG
jgi:phosphoglycolate phosphatase